MRSTQPSPETGGVSLVAPASSASLAPVPMPTPWLQVLKRRMSERKDDTERCVLLLRKLGEPDRTLQDRCAVWAGDRRALPAYVVVGLGVWAGRG